MLYTVPSSRDTDGADGLHRSKQILCLPQLSRPYGAVSCNPQLLQVPISKMLCPYPTCMRSDHLGPIGDPIDYPRRHRARWRHRRRSCCEWCDILNEHSSCFLSAQMSNISFPAHDWIGRHIQSSLRVNGSKHLGAGLGVQQHSQSLQKSHLRVTNGLSPLMAGRDVVETRLESAQVLPLQWIVQVC